MKVICKCCHKMFDYDMYMGLCPKCGRVYRREKGMYTDVEKDMVGDFHLHVDDGGLNRGIAGVVYNQGSEATFKNHANGFDDYMDDHSHGHIVSREDSYQNNPESATSLYRQSAAANASLNVYDTSNANSNVASNTNSNISKYLNKSTTGQNSSGTSGKNSSEYYSANHKTALNQPITEKKKNDKITLITVAIIIIISILMSILSN